MAKLADITIGVHEYFTESRLHYCHSFDCRFSTHKQGEPNCALKRIVINSDDKCASFDPKKTEVHGD